MTERPSLNTARPGIDYADKFRRDRQLLGTVFLKTTVKILKNEFEFSPEQIQKFHESYNDEMMKGSTCN